MALVLKFNFFGVVVIIVLGVFLWIFAFKNDNGSKGYGFAWVFLTFAIVFNMTTFILVCALVRIKQSVGDSEVIFSVKKLALHISAFALFGLSILPTAFLALHLAYSQDELHDRELTWCLSCNLILSGISEVCYLVIIYDSSTLAKGITKQV